MVTGVKTVERVVNVVIMPSNVTDSKVNNRIVKGTL